MVGSGEFFNYKILFTQRIIGLVNHRTHLRNTEGRKKFVITGKKKDNTNVTGSFQHHLREEGI